jgi:glycosyltransferase involved in cell wall biosynthesis
MQRIRVLFLIDKLVSTGGAEMFAFGLATHLPADRFETWLCSTRVVDAERSAALSEAGVKHVHLDRRTKWDVHRLATLPGLLRRERVDILHAHKFGSNVWGTLLGRAARVPIVLAHEQTWSYQGDPLRRFIDGQLIGRLATRFIAVSWRDAERMSSVEGVPPEKIVMIPNAYVPRPATLDGDLRTELGLERSTPVIGVVAVLRRQKALSVLLRAHLRVLDQIPDAHVVIAGDGECRAELEQLCRELGTTDRVHFLGERQDVDAILRSVDVAAISSDFEGTPLVAFECMANRTPLVATAVGGLPDIVRDGETGILVPPRDPAALADALTSVLRDPDRGRRLADASAATLGLFTIEAITARFADLYESLLAERGRPSAT